MLSLLRNYWKRFLHVLRASLVMVGFIVIFVAYFSWLGQRIFDGEVEGTTYFDTSFDAFWSMFVCLTTSNYPDVMLPAYKQNRLFFFFFFIFLILGLFLFMNMLLAIFYASYQDKSAELLDENNKTRTDYFNKCFDQLRDHNDEESDKHLNKSQKEKKIVKELFLEIHGLVEDMNHRPSQQETGLHEQ
jgi:two pore calcium channel protein, plant